MLKQKHFLSVVLAGAAFVPFFSVSPLAFAASFNKYDRVEVTSGPVNVRSSPSLSASVLGTQQTGELGTVIGGPTTSGGYTWWRIDYDSGKDGYSADTYLAEVSTTSLPVTTLQNGTALTGLSGAVKSYFMYKLPVLSGATNLRFVSSGGSGDMDLYAKYGSPPTLTSYDQKSNGSTNSETVTIASPQTGDYYLLVHGYASFTGASLTGSYTGGTAAPISITSFEPTNDATNVYYKATYTGSPTISRLFIDGNQNANSGYAIGGIGAEYLIENGVLFGYSGTGGTNWAWTPIKNVTYTNTNGTMNITVARVDLGSPNALDLYLLIGDNNSAVNTGKVTQTFADTIAPSTPANLSASALSSSQINLSWSASTDNVGVAGYKVYRGGAQIGTATGTTYSDTGLSAGTAYSYTVAAYDAVGNTSAQSTGASATTQAPSLAITSFQPTSDATNAYYKATYTGSAPYSNLYIDTDQNPNTGYKIGGIGAEYMIETGGLLYSYPSGGGAGTWLKNTPYSNSNGTINMTVARADIGSPSVVDLYLSIGNDTAAVNTGKVTQALVSTAVSVKNYGAKGDGTTDDSTAFQNALNANNSVYVPAGTYIVGNLTLKTNNEIYGDGATSILKQKAGAQYVLSANPGSGGSANPVNNIKNLNIHDLKLLGRAGTDPFDEHVYLLNLNAVSTVTVNNVDFVGYVGDGVYLGSGNAAGIERHNDHVNITNSRFDGVVKNNRNGISIIDGTDILVQYCSFTRSGVKSMPGGIDLEPDPNSAAYSRIKRITMDNLTFSDMGPVAMIVLNLLPNDKVTNPAQDITISNVHATGTNAVGQIGLGFGLGWGYTDSATATTPPLNLMVRDSSFDSVFRPFIVSGHRGIQIQNTSFTHSFAYASIGSADNTARPRELTFTNVLFRELGMDPTYGQSGVRLYDGDLITFSGSRFENIGATTGVGGIHLYFLGSPSSSSSYVKLLNNTFVDTLHRATYGIRVASSHTLTPSTNQQQGTVMTGVTGNDFLPVNTP